MNLLRWMGLNKRKIQIALMKIIFTTVLNFTGKDPRYIHLVGNGIITCVL